MKSINTYALSDVTNFGDRLEDRLSACKYLQEAAQICAEFVYKEFAKSAVLVRMYATTRFSGLPDFDKRFVRDFVESRNIAPLLNEDTIVLSLLGTSGVRAEWCERSRSRGHLALPLVTASFVSSIPMLSSLMIDMGIGLKWLMTGDTSIVINKLGKMVGVFYVSDARTSTDKYGRRIVPAQDFVSDFDIRTVFGLGGSFLNGTFVSLIIFSNESIERKRIEGFMPLMSRIKSATAGLIMGTRPRLFGI